MKKYSTYRDAGVNIDAGNEFVNQIKPLVRATFRPEVHKEIGDFQLRAYAVGGGDEAENRLHGR